ncbi:hypothetical protein NA56DRAFT_85041 [Hyaloscypha hepaticicola]|uniref:Uncharacterized protein n=1 Tax=Hyaloscypha hepaticicola TaxID=2082293 RepID=A0A2J6Q9W8_9HELO|nr:hypothetical protein NA56DRAFT_85041 [Hyaloscypha hepaticicola]
MDPLETLLLPSYSTTLLLPSFRWPAQSWPLTSLLPKPGWVHSACRAWPLKCWPYVASHTSAASPLSPNFQFFFTALSLPGPSLVRTVRAPSAERQKDQRAPTTVLYVVNPYYSVPTAQCPRLHPFSPTAGRRYVDSSSASASACSLLPRC